MKKIDNNKKNIIVIFGGKSVEHDISIITGVQTTNALDKNKYNIYPIYISKTGIWYTSEEFFDIKTFSKNDFLNKNKYSVVNISNDGMLCFLKKNKYIKNIKIDFAFLSTHGNLGENGALQGFLEICGISYSSPNVFSSAICMNKLATKNLLSCSKINVTNYVSLQQEEFTKNGYKGIEDKILKLKFPLIVKPCNLGSSVGITFCKTKEKLKDAVSFAFLFDSCVLVEEAVENLREVNLSIMGSNIEKELSVIEEVNIKNDFLTFENKYLNNESSAKGMENTGRTIPAKLEDDIKNKINEYGEIAYNLLDCKGIVRIDFLINDKTGEVFLNEVNTIPGSLSNYLWVDKGYTFSRLLDKVMDYAIKEKQNQSSKVTNFSSNVLNNFEKCTKLDLKK